MTDQEQERPTQEPARETDAAPERERDAGDGSEEASEAARADAQTSTGTAVQEATLIQFLSGMAAQALMHLGLMANPITEKIEVDLPNAEYSIDLLRILQEKTKGNLTEEEDRYLKNALYELRMRYVQVSNRSDATDEESKTDDAS